MKTLKTTLMAAFTLFAAVAIVSCKDPGDDPGKKPEPEPEQKEVKYTEFMPLFGEAGTKLSVIGENFGTDLTKVKVWLGDTELTPTEIKNGIRIDAVLPQIVGGIYKVKVKIGDEAVHTYDGNFVYHLTFSEVSTYAGIKGQSGAVNGALLDAKFFRPMTLAYDKKDDALFVHEDQEAGGKKLRRIKAGQVETMIDYTAGIKPNNIRSVAISITGDTLFFANDNGNNKANGSVFMARRANNDFKTLELLIGSNTANTGSQTDGVHFNFAAVNPVTGTLYMYSWMKKLWVWNKKGESTAMVADLAAIIPGTAPTGGNYSSLSFSLDGTKIYIVARNPTSAIFVADYDVAKDEISGEFKLWAGSSAEQGNVYATGTEARFKEPFHHVAGPDGYLYGGDLMNWSLHKISPDAKLVKLAGVNTWSGVNGPLSEAGFDAPASVAFDKNGDMFVADIYNQLIRKVTAVKQ